MKVRHAFRIGALALLAASVLIGCGGLTTGMSVDGRISQFVSSLNSDQATTYENLAPGSGNWSKAKDASFWETHFPAAEGPYTYVMISTSPYDETDVELTITSSVTGIAKTYKLVMQNAGFTMEEWYISDISVYSSTAGTWTSLFG